MNRSTMPTLGASERLGSEPWTFRIERRDASPAARGSATPSPTTSTVCPKNSMVLGSARLTRASWPASCAPGWIRRQPLSAVLGVSAIHMFTISSVGASPAWAPS
jgi:hypothetical protein